MLRVKYLGLPYEWRKSISFSSQTLVEEEELKRQLAVFELNIKPDQSARFNK